MSTEPQDQRPRRRALWLVFALVVLILAGAVTTALVTPGTSGPMRAITAATGFGTAGASNTQPPVNGNGQGNNGGGKGNGGTPTPTPAPTPAPPPPPAPAPAPAPVPNGNTSGQATGKSLTATVRSVTQLYPGRSGTLVLRVDNPNNQDVLLTGVTSAVTSVTSGTRAGIPRCDKAWFVIGGLAGSPRVAGRGSADVFLPVSMTNTSNVNQDNCKNVTFSFSFTVNGRQA